MTIVSIVRQTREQAGLSIRDLAKLADVSPSTVHLIEKGETNPTFETVENLLAACGSKLNIEATPDYGTNVFGLVQSIKEDIENEDTEWIIRKTAFFVSKSLRKSKLEIMRYLIAEPPTTGVKKWDCFIAGVVEWIMHQAEINIDNAWFRKDKYYLGYGWWIGEFESLKAIEYVNTPMSLKSRGIYIGRESLINR